MSKSPLRRFTDQLVLATMRPPISPQLLLNRPAIKPVELDGKRILVTGASSGIGEAAAELFAQHGATVVAVARRQDLLDAVADRITTAGGTAMSMPCDLSDMDAIDALVADVEKRIGGIDILVNNAARSIRRGLAESLERWHDVERTMVLNYYGPLRLIRGLAPGMLERGDGHIINVSTWGCDGGGVADVFGVQRVEGRAGVHQPGRGNRVGQQRGSFDDALLPVGRDSYDQTDEGI